MSVSSAPLAEILRDASSRLIAAGLTDETAHLDARVLMAHVLGLRSPAGLGLRLTESVEPGQGAAFAALIERRAQREPVGRILGQRGFWSFDLALGPDTLEPRPDTETLVEAVLARLTPATEPWRVLDLGTGTGCILLALLSELPSASGVGVDRAPGAVRVARANAVALGLEARADIREADWTVSGANGDGASLGVAPNSVDAVVSNPPYIETGALDALDPEVRRYDPTLALDGGPDGLDAYRVLCPLAMRLLRPGGWLAFEVGSGQAQDVLGLMGDAGFSSGVVVADLGGHGRCVLATRPLKKGQSS